VLQHQRTSRFSSSKTKQVQSPLQFRYCQWLIQAGSSGSRHHHPHGTQVYLHLLERRQHQTAVCRVYQRTCKLPPCPCLVIVIVSPSAAETPCSGTLNELIGCVSRFRVDLLRVPLEPAPLSIDATSEASPVRSPCISPHHHALTSDVVTFEVSQRWCHPFRLARLASRLPAAYELLRVYRTGLLRSSASLATYVCLPRSIFHIVRPNMQHVGRNVSLRGGAFSLASADAQCSMRLQPVVSYRSDGPCHTRCVSIEIPVPIGITLCPGATIALIVSNAGSPITLRIPAASHIHCATCNHKKAREGDVWRAAHAGDVPALEAALAAGGSTEESDGVSDEASGSHARFEIVLLACRTDSALGCAAQRGHVEAARFLLAAGADVNNNGWVSQNHNFCRCSYCRASE